MSLSRQERALEAHFQRQTVAKELRAKPSLKNVIVSPGRRSESVDRAAYQSSPTRYSSSPARRPSRSRLSQSEPRPEPPRSLSQSRGDLFKGAMKAEFEVAMAAIKATAPASNAAQTAAAQAHARSSSQRPEGPPSPPPLSAYRLTPDPLDDGGGGTASGAARPWEHPTPTPSATTATADLMRALAAGELRKWPAKPPAPDADPPRQFANALRGEALPWGAKEAQAAGGRGGEAESPLDSPWSPPVPWRPPGRQRLPIQRRPSPPAPPDALRSAALGTAVGPGGSGASSGEAADSDDELGIVETDDEECSLVFQPTSTAPPVVPPAAAPSWADYGDNEVDDDYLNAEDGATYCDDDDDDANLVGARGAEGAGAAHDPTGGGAEDGDALTCTSVGSSRYDLDALVDDARVVRTLSPQRRASDGAAASAAAVECSLSPARSSLSPPRAAGAHDMTRGMAHGFGGGGGAGDYNDADISSTDEDAGRERCLFGLPSRPTSELNSASPPRLGLGAFGGDKASPERRSDAASAAGAAGAAWDSVSELSDGSGARRGPPAAASTAASPLHRHFPSPTRRAELASKKAAARIAGSRLRAKEELLAASAASAASARPDSPPPAAPSSPLKRRTGQGSYAALVRSSPPRAGGDRDGHGGGSGGGGGAPALASPANPAKQPTFPLHGSPSAGRAKLASVYGAAATGASAAGATALYSSSPFAQRARSSDRPAFPWPPAAGTYAALLAATAATQQATQRARDAEAAAAAAQAAEAARGAARGVIMRAYQPPPRHHRALSGYPFSGGGGGGGGGWDSDEQSLSGFEESLHSDDAQGGATSGAKGLKRRQQRGDGRGGEASSYSSGTSSSSSSYSAGSGGWQQDHHHHNHNDDDGNASASSGDGSAELDAVEQAMARWPAWLLLVGCSCGLMGFSVYALVANARNVHRETGARSLLPAFSPTFSPPPPPPPLGPFASSRVDPPATPGSPDAFFAFEQPRAESQPASAFSAGDDGASSAASSTASSVAAAAAAEARRSRERIEVDVTAAAAAATAMLPPSHAPPRADGHPEPEQEHTYRQRGEEAALQEKEEGGGDREANDSKHRRRRRPGGAAGSPLSAPGGGGARGATVGDRGPKAASGQAMGRQVAGGMGAGGVAGVGAVRGLAGSKVAVAAAIGRGARAAGVVAWERAWRSSMGAVGRFVGRVSASARNRTALAAFFLVWCLL